MSRDDSLGLPPSIRTVPEAIAWWASRSPAAPALLPGSGGEPPVTYGALQERIEALVRSMARVGVAPGGRVAFLATGAVEAIVACLAVMRAGVAAPLPPTATEDELARMLERFAPELVLCRRQDATLHALALRAALPVLPFDPSEAEHAGVRSTGRGDYPDRTKNDLALILQTSGTTGLPRGIPRTHRNLLAASEAYAAWIGAPVRGRTLVSTPLCFGMGANAALVALVHGGALVPAVGQTPAAILRAVERWQPTWACWVPALLAELIRATEVSGVPSPRLQAIGVSGMAPSPELKERAEATFGAPVLEGYGCGEVGLIAGAWRGDPPGCFHRLLAEGIAVIDEEGAAVAHGSPGELIVWGPQVSPGYLEDPEATAASFLPNGAFRTGDLAVADEQGGVRLVGRIKEIINRGGEKLAPLEIDAALLAHPAVADAAAFPIADGRLGDEVAAAVVLLPGATVGERELRRAVASRLAPAKVPRRIWVVDALPRTASGKVWRAALRERFGGARDDDPSMIDRRPREETSS